MVLLPLPVFNFQEALSALIKHGAVSLPMKQNGKEG
jgi:hypothetical protein